MFKITPNFKDAGFISETFSCISWQIDKEYTLIDWVGSPIIIEGTEEVLGKHGGSLLTRMDYVLIDKELKRILPSVLFDSVLFTALQTLRFLRFPPDNPMRDKLADADIGFDYEDIIKMLWHDKDIMTGSYPIKNIRWDKVSQLVKQDVEPKDLMAKSLRYVINPVKDRRGVVEVDNGAINIYDAGTGFMLIKREVIEKMIEEYPHLKFKDDTGSLSEEEKKWTYAFFNSYIDTDGRFLSEDYGFCRYWQDMGGSVWVDPTIDMLHLGRMKFEGRMMDFLETIVVPETD